MWTVFGEAFAALGLLLAGIIVTLWPPRTNRAKRWWVAGFVLFGSINMGLGIQKSYQQAGMEGRLEAYMADTQKNLVTLTEQTKQPPSVTVNVPPIQVIGPVPSPQAVPSPSVSAASPEPQRRRNVLNLLRNEYILSHDGISSGLMAGTEWPLVDWMKMRLAELQENFTVEPGANLMTLRILDRPR